MTTVCFVTYKSGNVDRRVGPMDKGMAETMSKEFVRRDQVTEVRLEEWTCTRVTEVGKPA